MYRLQKSMNKLANFDNRFPKKNIKQFYRLPNMIS